MTDWVKGIPYIAIRFELPRGYHINVNISQHKSGKVTVYQSVGKLIGSFDDLMHGTLDLDDRFLNKINKILIKRIII
jgi:hypothetical protein